jgi:hypothetical protein
MSIHSTGLGKAARSSAGSADHSQTIPEFCDTERISLSFYYKLKRLGLGPREMELGKAKRISPEARAEWRRAREKQTTAED